MKMEPSFVVQFNLLSQPSFGSDVSFGLVISGDAAEVLPIDEQVLPLPMLTGTNLLIIKSR
jgi:hypothetical protein